MIRLEVTHGATAGAKHESAGDAVRIGRSADNDSGAARRRRVGRAPARRGRGRQDPAARSTLDQRHHARPRHGAHRDRRNAGPRDSSWQRATSSSWAAATASCACRSRSRATATRRTSSPCARSTSSAPPSPPPRATAAGCARSTTSRRASAAPSISNEVLVAVCDGAFALVPGATHVTVVLRDDDERTGARQLRPHRHARARTAGPDAAARSHHAQRLPQGRERARRRARRRRAARGRRRPSRSWARDPQRRSASRSGAATRSSASSRSTTARAPASSRAPTSS